MGVCRRNVPLFENSGESSVAASARRSSISKLVRNTCPDVRRISNREPRIRCCSSRRAAHHPRRSTPSRTFDPPPPPPPRVLLESSSIRFESTAISSRRPIILASPLARRETDPRSRAHSPRFELCDTDCTTAQQTTLYTESNAECLLQRSSSSFLSQLSADSFSLLLFFLFGNTCSLLVEARSGSGEIF